MRNFAIYVVLLLSTLSLWQPAIPVTGGPDGRDMQAARARDTAARAPKTDARSWGWMGDLPQGEPDQVVGVFVPGVLAQPVVQQRSSLDVSTDPEAITQFRLAVKYGSIGLLAHNYLIGGKFFEIEIGDLAYVIYGDGHYQIYRVTEFADYQALTKTVFREVNSRNSTGQYTLVDRIYGANNDRLVFQTCIEKNGNLSWGRRFILAELVMEMPAPAHEIFHPLALAATH